MTMTNKVSTPSQSAQELSGRTVLVVLVAFFGVVFAVNGYFAYAALQTYTGVVAQEPYRKGLTYNRRIDADARQSERGWTAEVAADRDGHARLDIAARDGQPVGGLAVTATLGRPSTDEFDRRLTFVETKPGHYESTVAALDAGNWIVTLAAREGGPAAEPVFQLRRRLWLKP